MTFWSFADERDVEVSLPPFGDLVASLGDIDELDEFDESGDSVRIAQSEILSVERIAVSLSIEMAIVPTATGEVNVYGSTPTQWTETTVMPVFHRLTMHVGQVRTSDEYHFDDNGEG